MRRGTEATWQSPGGPRGAQVALTRGRRPRGRSTWAPVWGATWQRVCMWRAHGYSGPWLVFRGGNALGVYRPLIYRGEIFFCLPCGTMFPHVSYLADDVATRRASDAGGTAEIEWTRVHTIKNRTRAQFEE